MIRTGLGVLMLASLLSPFGGSAHRKAEQGNRSYERADYEDALTKYTEAQVHMPEAPQLYYDIGNVLYREGDFEGAAEAYKRALLSAPPGLEPSAAYNLGNARFQQEEFESAAEAYRRALEAVPGDRDAKRNLELALRALEEQQQQQDDRQGDQQENPSDQQPPQREDQPSDDRQEDRQQRQDQGQNEDTKQQGEPRPSPQEGSTEEHMTPEQAQRLLDSLAEAEQKNLQDEAQRRAAVGGKKLEKDW